MWDIIVIGGGASGMMAALTAKQEGARTLLIEKEKRLGRKLAATGNGTCNLSHRGFGVGNFHGASGRFLQSAFMHLDEEATLDFFHHLGLEVICDERNRYYPFSKSATAVVDIFRMALRDLGVSVLTDTRVLETDYCQGDFTVRHSRGEDQTKTVIVACGGEAAPQLGGCSDGYQLLKNFGHLSTKRAPGIVQLVVDNDRMKSLKGLHWQVKATAAGRSEWGELLFTDYGLSGPPIFQLSSTVQRELFKSGRVRLSIDLLPEYGEAALATLLVQRAEAFEHRPLDEYLVGFLPKMLAFYVLRYIGVEKMSDPIGSKSPKTWQHLARALKALPFEVIKTRSFRDAQVTIGGVIADDFDAKTMMSKKQAGLFACGEVLDVDGDCGGYNLQWAWSSGRLAGYQAAHWEESLERRRLS